MRTTVEIPDHQRAKLLEIAAMRGLKGFSVIVQEAIDRYIEAYAPRDEKVEAALSVLGTMSDGQADAMEASITRLRENW